MTRAEQFMHRAISLAEKGQFTARPNPCVGAVLVRDHEIIGEGYHAYYGGPHAEVMALAQAGERARGATCYVTLEPCAHQGKTPPCTEALIQAGVSKVVAAMEDPNPLVAGKGFARLREAGLTVEVGLLGLQAQNLNLGFLMRMEKKRPRVILKSAMSLDGRTAMKNGESKWITGEAARAQVQILRAQSDAIITGRGTVEADEPGLNVRDPSITALPHFQQPRRIVLDSTGRLQEKLLKETSSETWQVTAGQQGGWQHHMDLPAEDGRVDLHALLSWLVSLPCNQVMVEAGSSLAASFLKANLVDAWHVFIAPLIMGSDARALCEWPLETMAQAHRLSLISSEILGSDLYCIYN